MTRHRLHPTRAAIPAAMLLALVTLAGCAAWKPVPSADPTVAADSVVVVGHGRITLMSGERIDVEHVTVDRDSVRALRIERDRRDTMSERTISVRSPWSAPRSDVARIEERHVDAGHTGLCVVAVLGVVGVILADYVAGSVTGD